MNTKIVLSKSAFKIPSSGLNLGANNILNFEKSLENYLRDNKYVVALNSGTSAIHLALILAGVAAGDEVLCQTFTYVATVNPILYQKAIPIFIDSETTTWNMCPLLLEEAILDRISKGKKPKAIIYVHSYGMPAMIDEISSIASKYEIILIEDAAEALGSMYKGKKCGTFGDFGIFSFNNNKIMTTFGGGALICKNTIDKDKAIFLATQAKEDAPHYEHAEIGYNYSMSSILAGIGVLQMKNIAKYIHLRKRLNADYKEFFKDVKGVAFLEEPNANFLSNQWLTCILIDEKIAGFNNQDLRATLLNDNIESRFLWKPMHLQPAFKTFLFFGKKNSETLFNKGLCLPSSAGLTKTEFNRITLSINKLL
jgi:dTDP-4-amino-4,6-dideoxygalactose transaminase